MAHRFTLPQYLPYDPLQGTVNRQAILREDPSLMCEGVWQDINDIDAASYPQKKGLTDGTLNEYRMSLLISRIRG